MAGQVFFDHDGGVDDFVALLLLLSYDVDVLGISVTPADTYLEAALPATRKILGLAGRPGVPAAAGTLEGLNPFPHPFRIDSLKVDAMPVLNRDPEPPGPPGDEPGQQLLARTILEAGGPVTLVMTGPLTNLAWALDHHPGVEAHIDELVLMGGALDVPGNVRQEGHDGSAEWNIFWDPAAARRVWDSDLAITIFSLDATDQVPVTPELRRSLAGQSDHVLSEAAGCFWALTAGSDYYCWDTLTVSYLARPDLCTFREVRCEVVTEGPSQGRTIPSADGRSVRAADLVDTQGFYEHVLATLRRGGSGG
ncbi:MAG: nucleoside hydrolase [Acidimicrobiia bacterium]